MDPNSRAPYAPLSTEAGSIPPNPGFVPQGEYSYVPAANPPPPNAPDFQYGNNPGYPPQGGYVPPQGYPPQGYPPQGYPPQGYPPQGFPPQGYPPQGFPPQGYAPPPQGYGYPPGQPVQINIINSKLPSEAMCPNCHDKVTSLTVKRPGNSAWCICLVLMFFCFPFCLYPLICDPCLDTYHVCPKCQGVISVKSPF